MQATPSNDLSKAGVLVNSFDMVTSANYDRPWRPCERQFCMGSASRLSCTMIRPNFTTIWADQLQGGFVMNPTTTAVRCAYARDGHTVNIPSGCRTWCYLGEMDFYGCAWRPEEMRDMLEEQQQRYGGGDAALPQYFGQILQDRYNEIVVDSASWMDAMPAAVEAIYVHAASSAEEDSHGRRVHATFVADYALEGRAVPPLLEYDGQRVPPFRSLD